MKSGMLVWDGRTLTSTRKGSYVQRCRYGAGVDGWKRGDEKKIVGCSTGTSREVTHPSTIPAQRRLTSEF
jgi:hypothetical protein